MKDQYTLKTKTHHWVCIHLKPMHYHFLVQLAQKHFRGNLQKALLYLLDKFLPYLIHQKQHLHKKTLTITYQPPTKDYQKFWVEVNPLFWGEMNQLRFYLGFSMSCIIRILIEWEMEEEGERISCLIQRPRLNPQNHHFLSEFRLGGRWQYPSYKVLVWGKYRKRRIGMMFFTKYG